MSSVKLRGFDLTQSSAFPALLIKAVDCKRRTKNAVYVSLDSYLSNTPTNLCMALLNFSLFASFCIVLLLYSIVIWRQYNTMPCINLLEYWTTLSRLRHLAIQNSIKWIILLMIALASKIKLRLYVLKYTTKILLAATEQIYSAAIAKKDFSLKIKQLTYLLFSSQQLPAWVYSYIILEDECWCTLPLLLPYVTTSLQHENQILMFM